MATNSLADSAERLLTGNAEVVPRSRHVLFILENLPVPLDRRAWQQARCLKEAGYAVTVICPRNGAFPAPVETLEGIRILRHWLPLEARGAGAYMLEYVGALFWEFVLTTRLLVMRGFDVIHAGNPPDTIFIVGIFFKLCFGKKFVFDYRDLSPELYELKFGKRGALHHLLRLCERATLRVADRVIANNPTFAERAVQRGGVHPDDVAVVRHGPDLSRLKPVPVARDYRCGRRHLVLYLGVMGSQDGVDLLLHAAHHAVRGLGREDVQFLLVGAGPELAPMRQLCAELGLDDHVTFTGFLTGRDLFETLSSADIGVAPDPKNPLNDRMSMNKILEYMAFGLPVAMFDLEEGRHLAGACAVCATDNDPCGLALAILGLLDDAPRRQALGQAGRDRVQLFSWERERVALLRLYEDLWTRETADGAPSGDPARST